MALVPHKITALAESDAEGTDGKNIIAGAVVSLYDPSGAAVTLFDDESGSNGSTAKQTDASGQVVVYITPGEYDEEVNGSIKRRISVGGNSVISYGTTAGLESSRPNKTGQRAENRERANAQYVLAASGYVAKPGDIVAANGRVWELQIDHFVKPEWFGAKGDGVTDDTAALQSCIDRANGNRGITVTLEPKLYIYSALSVTNPINMHGVSNRTDLRSTLSSGTCVNISTPQQCLFSDLTLSHSVTRTGGETVLIYNPSVQNTRTTFNNVVVASPFDGINAKSTNALRLINCYFTSYKNNAVMVENEVINDSGDHYFAGCTWDAGLEGSGVGIRQVNSGGLKLIGNKFLAGAYHYLSAFNQTGTIQPFDTSVLTVTGNSFENCTVAAMAFNAVSPTIFKYASITGNQFSLNGATGILFTDPGHDYAFDFVISSNTFNMGGTSPVGVNAGRLNRSLIMENIFLGNTTGESGIIVGANSKDIKIGPQKFTSIATEWNVNTSASDIEFYGGLYDFGTETASTSNAYGSLFATPTINVSFAEQMPVIPKVSVTPLTGGGVISAAVTGVTKTGFQMLVYGITNGGNVSVNWEAGF